MVQEELLKMWKPNGWRETLIVLGFTVSQPLWVICVVSQREGEEIAEEMKERNRGERGKWMKVKKQKHSLSTLTCCKDSRPCQTVSQNQLDVPVTQDTPMPHLTTPGQIDRWDRLTDDRQQAKKLEPGELKIDWRERKMDKQEMSVSLSDTPCIRKH